MAPIDGSFALSHVEGVSDNTRARELYKYYQPTQDVNSDTCFPSTSDPSPIRPSLTSSAATAEKGKDSLLHDQAGGADVKSTVTSSKISSPDTALTAFCQLVSWRIGAERAMISLIDAQTQYFVAESTKTVDLVDNTKHAPGDDIWMGCTSVSKTGRLCERTLEAKATDPSAGEYPSFIVNDLSKDERFNELPFVTGPPHLRFYAGVPLVTKRGIAIGSLFIVDSRTRNGLPKDDVRFMGTMASTIMRHLEMVRETEEHRRGMKMSRGLACFVEGRAELPEADADDAKGDGTNIAGHFGDPTIIRSDSRASGHSSSSSQVASTYGLENKERRYAAALAKTERDMLLASQESAGILPHPSGNDPIAPSMLSGGRDVTPNAASVPVDTTEVSAMKMLFSRAANLIREAFEVDGGAVFYDAQQGFNSDTRLSPSIPSSHGMDQVDGVTSGEDLHSSGDSSQEHATLDQKSGRRVRKPDSPGLGESISSPKSLVESKNVVKILGFSTADASSLRADSYPGPSYFQPFEEKALHTLLRRYPRGRLWTFDSDGSVSSSSEDDLFKSRRRPAKQRSKDVRHKDQRSARLKSDAMYLSRHFPGVRQLLFVPLWDASRGRWLSGCFAWSTEPTRILSKQNELSFLSAFSNSVMAECSRIDTEMADQKKGDFIGSISHELRSPLHGILASAELLGEEELSGFKRGLVETIDSCGRTLLDTINHVLDFSKINHFEKTWRKTKRGGEMRPISRNGGRGINQSDMPMINLFADVDVSLICEEVVEGVFAGHVFQNVTAQSFDMVPGSRGKMSDPKTVRSSSVEQLTTDALGDPEVHVILDVDMHNYLFTTQPGAVRRVIMNLLGNALKYTAHGYVRLKLEAAEMDDLEQPGSAEKIPRSLVVLTVTDTGRGISSDFLRSKLFTPFAQENSLSSGTGLGLSIVRSIVALLEGQITIDSELGQGTQVRVTLPLLREMPKVLDSSASTPKSVASLARDVEDSVTKLQASAIGQQCSLYGFDLETDDPVLRNMSQLLMSSITNFLAKWYGFRIVPLGTKGTSIVIANEAKPDDITRLTKRSYGSQRKPPSVLVLCSHSSRFDRHANQSNTSKCNVGFVAKPVGPVKLARAIMLCLDDRPPTTTTPILEVADAAESNDLSNVFEDLSVFSGNREMLDNSRMSADSENARKAIESPTPNALLERKAEYPFPAAEARPSISQARSMPSTNEGLRSITASSAPLDPQLLKPSSKPLARTIEPSEKPLPRSSVPVIAAPPSSAISIAPVPSSITKSADIPLLPPPCLLLVDDNKINLTLLRTYVRKRNYITVDESENGLDAVAKVQARADGYDIIFMDISMPVLDGFGATRRIRQIEEARRRAWADRPSGERRDNEARGSQTHLPRENEGGSTRGPSPPPSAALVIALTGLASSRDQDEAFSSGVDLFLTKPVSFKEVGKMLDNWEANRAREFRGPEVGGGERGAVASTITAAAAAALTGIQGRDTGMGSGSADTALGTAATTTTMAATREDGKSKKSGSKESALVVRAEGSVVGTAKGERPRSGRRDSRGGGG